MLPLGMADRVMHASLGIGDSTVMTSDDCSGAHSRFQGFQLSLAEGGW